MGGGLIKAKLPYLYSLWSVCEENPPDSHWARVPPRRCGERVSLIIFADFFQYGFFAHFLRTYTADYWTESLAHLLFNDNFPLSINTFSSRKIYRHNLCWAPHLICSFAKNKSQFNPHSHKGSFSIHQNQIGIIRVKSLFRKIFCKTYRKSAIIQ